LRSWRDYGPNLLQRDHVSPFCPQSTKITCVKRRRSVLLKRTSALRDFGSRNICVFRKLRKAFEGFDPLLLSQPQSKRVAFADFKTKFEFEGCALIQK